MEIIYYLAYGSNLHPVRLKQRVPSSHSIGWIALSGYTLRFHKISEDGSAKCDALYTGNKDDSLLGVIYAMHAQERGLLDQAESLNSGYRLHHTTVQLAQRQYKIFFYTADPAYIDLKLAPYDWYKNLVVEGAKYHRLPAEYIQTLLAIPVLNDPDQKRANKHQAILNASI